MEAERKFCGYTWEEMNCVLDMMCAIEDEVSLNDQEQKDYDVAIQCITQIMNRMKDGKPINWD